MSELKLVDRIASRVAVRPGVVLGIGDDAAVLAGDPAVVATHDLLVDGVHFRRSTTGFADLGHKSLATNLSDLAAMGAEPVAVLVGLGLPLDGIGRDDVDQFYAGMENLAARVGATVAGGDLTEAPALVIAVTAIGHMPAGTSAVRRDGARPGDILCVTGAVGGATAGLAALERPELAARAGRSVAAAAIRRHLHPEPRLAEGALLRFAGATAMLDISDGVGIDALRLARASGVSVEIEVERLPLDPSLAPLARAFDRDAALWAIAGGEDYELLAALPPGRAERVGKALPAGLTPIGRIAAGAPAVHLVRDGAVLADPDLGFLHRV